MKRWSPHVLILGGDWQSLIGGSTQNWIVGISWCIMGHPFSSWRCTVFALPLWNLGYIARKSEDRLVYSFSIKTEHYFACQMLLRATCRRNKLNLLNSNGKMVTVDPLNSDHWSSPQINTWSNCLFMRKLKFTVDPLNSNYQSSPPPQD